MIFALTVMPAYAAAEEEEEEEEDSVTVNEEDSNDVINYNDWFNPADGVNELGSSPVGSPLKKFINLIIGGVIIYGAGSIIKSWFKSNSDDGETASDGWLGMGSKAVGALVMVGCVALYFYFLGYKL